MLKYIVTERFADLQDDRHIYNAGDTFPRVGLSVSEERLVELSSSKNRLKRPLLKEVTTNEAKAPNSDTIAREEAIVEKTVAPAKKEPVKKPVKKKGK